MGIANPFSTLTVLPVDDVGFKDNGYYRLLVEKVREGGLGHARQYCRDSNTWKDFIRQLGPLTTMGPAPCPSQMFELHWRSTAAAFLDALRASPAAGGA